MRAHPTAKKRTRSTNSIAEYSQLEPRNLLATIQLIAAGQTNDETLELQIDGLTVQAWNNLGGDALGNQFVTLDYTTPNTVTPSQIRVLFPNDAYDPIDNYDRNVRLDAIVVDGELFETEAPDVFSTGTWTPVDGIVPGFRESEWMHTSGYFEFADPVGGGDGTLVEVRARGQEGGERFELQIDGVTVSSHVVPTSFDVYSWQSPTPVDASQVRIRFVNDRWEPANNRDWNLIIDYMALDSNVYQTESPTTYSTGTWRAGIGVAPGYLQTQILTNNGYFQYERPPQHGYLRIESSVVHTAENGGSVVVTVVRDNGSEGTITTDFRTVAISAVEGVDFEPTSGTLTFPEGVTSRTVAINILDDDEVEADETFGFSIDNVTGGGVLSAPRTATITIEDNDVIRAAGPGLLGEYFDDLDFANRFLNRVDSTIDFDWTLAAPAIGMQTDTYSIRWTGRIEPRFSETYSFQTLTDDGVRLWIDNTLIIDEWQDQAASTYTGTIDLLAGVLYDIRMEYYENQDVAVAQLSWQSAQQSLEVIPKSQLYAASPPPITPGDELQSQTLISGLVQPTAVKFSSDGTHMFIAEQRGVVRVVNNGVLQTEPFLDFRYHVNGTRDRGLLDIAVHPDFPNTPYVYLLYTYDPTEVHDQPAGTLAGPDGNGNRTGRLTRVTADATTDFTTIIPDSEVVLIGKNGTWNHFNAFANSTFDFNEPPAGILLDGSNLQDFIATDSESHTVGSLNFASDGSLFVSIGDGVSYNQVDPRAARVQDIDNLSGKILRIDPITGEGLADNPFYDGNPDSNRSKVYQSGLRNPFRTTVDPVTDQLYIGEVGWTQWEEINAGAAGANFGWPWYEGGSGVNKQTGGYRNLAAAQAFYASGTEVTPSIYALNHSTGINAIVLGDVYDGTAYPSKYQGNLFFNDLGQGIVRNIRFATDGRIEAIETFATGHRYVVQMTLGPDQNIYYVDLDNGEIGRWVFVESNMGTSSAGTTLPTVSPGINPNPSHDGNGITVAIIDSGFNNALTNQLWQNVNEILGDGIDNDHNGLIDDVHGFDFLNRTGDVFDETGHGSFVANLIVDPVNGIASGASIMPLKVLGANRFNGNQTIASAIRYAVDHGAQIVVLPLVLAPSSAVRDAISFAEEQGTLVVVAAGNASAAEPSFLAQLSAEFGNVISAGATQADGSRLLESNRVGDSGAIQIDSPGVSSALGSDGMTITYRGTSVAAGWLAGVAAQGWAHNRHLTANQIRQMLLASSLPVGSGSDSSGRLDQAAFVEAAMNSAETIIRSVGGTTRVWTGPSADSIRYQVGSPNILINGVSYNLPDSTRNVRFVGDANDQLNIVGTRENEFAQSKNEWAMLRSEQHSVSATGFAITHLIGGGGNDQIILTGTAGDDRVTMDRSEILLLADQVELLASGFQNIAVNAGGGYDHVEITGTDLDDQLFVRPATSRLVSPDGSAQVIGFESIDVSLGMGSDRVSLLGTNLADSLSVAANATEFHSNGRTIRMLGGEELHAIGAGGNDSLSILGSDVRDTVYSQYLFTRWLGPNRQIIARGFEDTVLDSGGDANDVVTIKGTSLNESVSITPTSVSVSGSAFSTSALGFQQVKLLGGGGWDHVTLDAGASTGEFTFQPDLSRWTETSRTIQLRQFEEQEVIGNANYQVQLRDGAKADRLELSRDSVTLSSDDYRVSWHGLNRLWAFSEEDEADDSIVWLDDHLEYAATTLGDWMS
ncbi:MAG: PQQ-dependent sugar dehydrogenase [Pirellulaceae bacterium]